MIIFGLTGGIACGKSTVSNYWNKKYQIPIIDADLINRKIVESNSPCLNEIEVAFGKTYINSDGTLDRKSLGNLVFGNPGKRVVLENIMAGYFCNEYVDECRKLSWAGHKIVCFDNAVLIEQNYLDTKPLVVVISTEQNQIKRLVARNNLTEQEARQRINSQLSNEEKIKCADFVIENDFTNSILEEQADKILMKVMLESIK